MPRETRRLAAIVAADVVGYSRLMEADEAGTLKRLKAARAEVTDPAIAEYGGRMVSTTGDGFLAEFPSAVDAVQCAASIQETMAQWNADAPNDRRLQLRIGVNLGDVIIDGDDIFGDGVNVAARLEALADPGGVWISQAVHALLRGEFAERFEDAGEHRVKNISRPVSVLRWTGASGAPSAEPNRAGRIPAVAVLPFAHGEDAELRDLANGVCDDISSVFAARSGIRMIGRSISAEAAKGENPVARLKTDHRADYVLTGALRRGGQRARLTAELVDTESGQQIWSNRFDLDLEDIFTAQDTLTERVAMAVRTAMNRNEGDRVADLPDERLTDAEHRAKAAHAFYRFSAEGFAEAGRHLDIVLARNPEDAMALSMEAFRTAFEGYHSIYPIPPEKARRAIKLAERGVQLGNTSDYSYSTRGLVSLHVARDPDAAIEDARLCLELQPQYAIGLTLLGEATAYAGRPEEGIPLIRKPIESDPRDPLNFIRHWMLGMAYFAAADYPAALGAVERGLRGQGRMPAMQLAHAVFLVKCGQVDAAREVVARLRRLYPKATLATIHQPLFKQAALRESYLDALREAGMPDS